MIGFIINGNRTVGKTLEERIAITLGSQKKWHGKRVSFKTAPERHGTVKYLVGRRSEEIDRIRESGDDCAPFKLAIKWDDGALTIVCIYMTVPLDEAPAPTA